MIVLLRHGLDDESRMGGWSNVDLLPEGKEQIKQAANYMIQENLDITRIIASDLKRTQTTAEIIADAIKKPIIYTTELRELNKGKLNGMDLNDVKVKYPEFYDDVSIQSIYPDGESLEQLYKRIERILPWILKQDKALLVTHRGVINMIYYILQEKELDNDKKQFNVVHGSVHELNPVLKKIKRIF